MNDKDNGGPAFPVKEDYNETQGRYVQYASDGMTLRDYFIAHAPNEPQPWFQPVMCRSRPILPMRADLNPEHQAEFDGVGDWIALEDATSVVRSFVESLEQARKDQLAWDAEYTKRFFTEWPAAWADAMLEARKQ